MNADKRRTLFKGFVVCQFNYWPLVWMFRTKQLNNRINSLHEKDFSLTHTQAPGWLTMLYWLHLFLLYFYGRLYVLLRYLILEYLQVLNKNWKRIIFFKNDGKNFFCFSWLLFDMYFTFCLKYIIIIIYLALIRLFYCRGRVQPNENKIHIRHF